MPVIGILGAAGAIGHAVSAELERRGASYRVVGRSRSKLEAAFPNAEAVEADLADRAAAAEACRGLRTAIYAVGVPYTQFGLHPVLMRSAIEAAAASGVERMVVVSSVYSYGKPRSARVSEQHPRAPETFKGRMRKEQEDIALDAHRLGRLRTQVVRLPNFYGPHAELSLAHEIFRAALDGKTANWLGPLDVPQEFIYVPDAGPVILDLASRDDCFGESWNLGGPGTITGGEFIESIYAAAGRKPKWRSAGKGMLRLMGLFSPFMRELAEMFYLQTNPVILDDARLRAKLGEIRRIPYPEGIRRTIDWMRAGRR